MTAGAVRACALSFLTLDSSIEQMSWMTLPRTSRIPKTRRNGRVRSFPLLQNCRCCACLPPLFSNAPFAFRLAKVIENKNPLLDTAQKRGQTVTELSSDSESGTLFIFASRQSVRAASLLLLFSNAHFVFPLADEEVPAVASLPNSTFFLRCDSTAYARASCLFCGQLSLSPSFSLSSTHRSHCLQQI